MRLASLLIGLAIAVFALPAWAQEAWATDKASRGAFQIAGAEIL
jgi:hypothetical protein